MEKNYKITIFTTEEFIERDFHNEKIALSTIVAFKERFNDFKIGILWGKTKGKWNPICSIAK